MTILDEDRVWRHAVGRHLHDHVVQPLFGVSLALGASGQLDDRERLRCHAAVEAGLDEVRVVIADVIDDRAASTGGRSASDASTDSLERDVRGVLQRFDRLPVRSAVSARRALPPPLHGLATHVVEEALRNAGKHAAPTDVAVTVDVLESCVAVEVINDGALTPPALRIEAPRAGVGLKMLAAGAAEHRALLAIDAPGRGLWRVRLLAAIEGEM